MAQAGKSPFKSKGTQYVNAILITALSLFLLGLMGLTWLSFRHEQNRIKENIKISAFLFDDVTDVEALRKKIETNPKVKSTEYISKDDAAEIVKEKYGEDVKSLLDYNPLPASIEVFLEAENVTLDSMEVIKKELEAYKQIKYAKVDENLVSSINANFRVLGIVVTALGLLFLLISIAIIDKTIRLSMYSNRFLIRSMQLVGATRNFVTGPYVRRSILNGLISAGIASFLLLMLILLIQSRYKYWDFNDSSLKAGILLIIVTLAGIGLAISWYSTRNAVHKYIKMKLDELY
jgi:cell division transport system permease protein